MRVCLGTATAGQKGQTRGPASARGADVREEASESAKCFFNDLCRLNGDRPKGAPSKEYKERERVRDLLVASYVSSYDVDDEVLEDNRSGPEGEEEKEQQDPLQEDHVDVTNLLNLLNRSVTLPLPPDSD